MKNGFSQSMHSLFQFLISSAYVICNVCCERVHLSCCDSMNDLGLTNNLCCKRFSDNKPCSIPVDLRKKRDSDHGIPSANLQAPSNQLTSRFTQHHLEIDSSNEENSSNFISLNDLIDNITINDKITLPFYKLCSKRELSYSPVN